jgi:esterase
VGTLLRGRELRPPLEVQPLVGDEAWEAFPRRAKQMFIDNGPAIVAEFRGPWLQATETDLGRISVPTLLVAGTDSPEPLRRATERMAAAIPNSRTAFVGGGHFIDPGEPSVIAFVRSVLAG